MIKLKETLIKESPIAYHVAEENVRNSIKKYGLDPNKYSNNDRTTNGNYIYVFLKYSECVSYINAYNYFLKRQDEDEKYFDIWEINTEGLRLIKDLNLNTGDDPMKDSAYFTKAPINKKRLKLKEMGIQ